MVETGKINLNSIQKIFPPRSENASEVEAVHQVSATIKPGEFIALIGPSGCGKSTLLRMIAGLELPTTGGILLDDEIVTAPSRERGFVFQEANLYPWLTVEDNVAFGLKINNKVKNKKAEIQQFIELVGLKGFEKSYPYELSGGMQQRVSLARTLINYPKVLLLDEPFGALDAFTRMRIHDELIKIWQERKLTTVMVTHDVEEAVYLADRVFAMTPRPAILKEIIDIDLPHNRHRESSEFIALKTKVLKALNFQD
ncbi:ABC transporter ATP-binding protein [Lactococcus nasutitermitis]|uniref:ABC transporter ATP-binding protein n=1 Tax=Lactococcus nasutitermitis TaxID=1652957 RepID=A0ABV9JDC5_9LACT|nr:ABC transporter ATP-binding protein [Lactococcus nasutitermitis]